MIFVFDIDLTVLESKFENGKYVLIKPYKDMILDINNLYCNGNTIIMQTGRHWNHLLDTIEHLKECNIKYHTLEMGKPYADFYIDDKGITPEEFLKKNTNGDFNGK